MLGGPSNFNMTTSPRSWYHSEILKESMGAALDLGEDLDLELIRQWRCDHGCDSKEASNRKN
jgi:hypothetical protein